MRLIMRRIPATAAGLLLLLSVGWLFAAAAEVPVSVIDQTQKSVYLVQGQKEYGRYSCTGFLIADQLVLTAAHCTRGESMTVAGLAVHATVADDYYDLALLTVPIHGTPLLFREAPVVRFEALAAFGYAHGWTRITVAHVQVYHIDLIPGEGMRPGILVRPGHIGGMSGGPLIDEQGLVVGIIQASNADLGYGVGVTLIRAFLVGLL